MGPCYRRQYWDGTFSPANFLHLLTCKFFTCSIGMAPSHLQFFSGRFFTCSFGMAPCRAAKFTAKKIINGIMAVLPQRLHVSRWKCKIHRKQKWSKESWYKSLVKNAKITENKNDQCNHATNLPLKMRKSTKTKTINGIMLQIFRKKRESQQKQKWSIEPKK